MSTCICWGLNVVTCGYISLTIDLHGLNLFLSRLCFINLVMSVSVKSNWNHPNMLISQLNSQLQLDIQSCLIATENSTDQSKIMMANCIANWQVSMLCQVGLAVIASLSNCVNYTQYRWQIKYLHVCTAAPHIKMFLSKVWPPIVGIVYTLGKPKYVHKFLSVESLFQFQNKWQIFSPGIDQYEVFILYVFHNLPSPILWIQ